MPEAASHDRRYIISLAIASVLILALGWLVRPRDGEKADAPLPSESDLAQLARHAERSAIESTAQYFAETAERVEPSLLRIPSLGVSGVVWSDHVAVTPPLSVTATMPLDLGGSHPNLRLRTIAAGPNLPLAMMAPENGSFRQPPLRRPASAKPGTWVVAVWQTDHGRAFASGTFAQAASTTCGLTPVVEVVSSIPLARTAVGGGLFDIDGNLLAVVLPCEEHVVAIATATIETILEHANSLEQRLIAEYGVVVASMSESDTALFNNSRGLLVRETWSGLSADRAGVRPGDVIVAVDDGAVTRPEDLRPMAYAADGSEFAVTLLRRSKPLRVTLSSRPGVPGTTASRSGVHWATPPEGYAIDAVRPDSRAEHAGLHAGDRIVRVDFQEPRTATQIDRLLDSDGGAPIFVEIDRRGRRLGLIVR